MRQGAAEGAGVPVSVDLFEALSSATARFIALSELGSAIAPPSELDEFAHKRIDTGAPLEVLEPETHGLAVLCFATALDEGRGTCQVHLADDGSSARMLVFNELDTIGCLVSAIDTAFVADTNSRARGVVNETPVRRVSMRMDASGNTLSIDENFTKLLGWTMADLDGKSSRIIAHPDDRESSLLRWVDLLENPGAEIRDRKRFRTIDGTWIWFDLFMEYTLAGPNAGVLMEATDVSTEMRAQSALVEREALLTRLTEALPGGVLHVGLEGETVVSNEAWTTLTGCDRQAGMAALSGAVDAPAELQRELRRAIDGGLDVDVNVRFGAGGGICEHGLLHLRPIVINGAHAGLLITLDDLTQVRAHQDELASQARRDVLTNVLNRRGIEEVVQRALGETGETVAVLFVDLDKFKLINDTWGHALGDQVLQTVAERISELLRPTDFLGRLGGDEFLAVLVGLATNDDVVAVMRRIERELPTLAVRFREPVAISATVGAAYARSNDDFDALIHRADEAMYAAKGS